MRLNIIRVASSLFALMGVSASVSATVLHPPAVNGKTDVPRPQTAGPRTVRSHDARGSIVVTGPPGCSSSGPYSFIGGGYNSYAGYAGGVLTGVYNEACDAYSSISAGYNNIIGGDGYLSGASVASGSQNDIEASSQSFIGSGASNLIGKAAPYYGAPTSVIVGGSQNLLTAPSSFIGAGNSNQVLSPAATIGNGPASFIGAGYGNSITADFAVIGGGYHNVLTGEYSTVGGGYTNNASGSYGTIAGGFSNVASAIQATVGGGYGNIASGRNSTIPGGAYNVAGGLDSFAAGNASHATYDGTFVWSDYSTSSSLTSSAPNQFLARAAGGFFLYSSAAMKSGVRLAPGSGSWSNLSDRASKTAVANVDEARILAKLVALPVSEWSYTEQGSGVRHLGPMAQDFRASFGLGEDDTHISAVDEEGVALAAIKALQAEVSAKNRELLDIRRSDEAAFAAKYARLERRLDALESRLEPSSATSDEPRVTRSGARS